MPRLRHVHPLGDHVGPLLQSVPKGAVMDLIRDTFLALALGEADDLGYFGRRTTPNGRSIALIPLTFGRARLVIIEGDNPVDGW